eukprot:COSAG05_NODE_1738_length_4162_cov_10.776028_4_plen_88_part_00
MVYGVCDQIDCASCCCVVVGGGVVAGLVAVLVAVLVVAHRRSATSHLATQATKAGTKIVGQRATGAYEQRRSLSGYTGRFIRSDLHS